jgi:N-methylhydantoinase B
MELDTRRVNANVARSAAGTLSCTHCGHAIDGTADDYLTHLPRYEGPVIDAGPQVFPDSAEFIDVEVVFRQYYCPGCYTAFRTEVVPRG